MLKVAIRGVFARRLRFLLTTVAVALGVMLMAGSFIFTDTFSKGFDKIFAAAFKGTDVSVSAKTAFTPDQFQEQPTVPQAALDRIKSTPGVSAAEGSVFDSSATILDKKGKPIKNGGAPQSIASTSDVAVLSAFKFPTGRAPKSAGEVALDQATFDRRNFKLGDTVRVQGSGAVQPFKLVGALTLGGSGAIGGSSIALVTLPEAQQLTGKVGQFDSISVAAKQGVTPEVLKARVARELGPRYDVKTGKQQQEDSAAEVRSALTVIRTALLAFAGIALFVGAFLIFNTFSITVAQRLRELALLRTLGASRRQVRRSVLTEGLIIGLVGSLIGLGLGVLIAIGLRTLLSSGGIELPNTGLVLQTRTIIVALSIGILITVVSAWLPAARAMRIPPIAALQEGAVLPKGRGARFFTPVAILCCVLGSVIVALGLLLVDDATNALLIAALGALIAFLGVGLLSPKLVVPLAGFIGAPMQRARGLTGQLARENTMREPGRTAITSSALMVGVALVTFALIFTASFKATLATAVNDNLMGDAIVQDNGNQFQLFTGDAATAIGKDPKVATVSGVSQVQALLIKGTKPADSTSNVAGVDPDTFSKLYKIEIKKGPENAVSRLGTTNAVVDSDFAKKHGLEVGSPLRMVTASGQIVQLHVIATKHDTTDLTGDVIVSNEVAASSFGTKGKHIFVMIDYKPGVDATQATKELGTSLEKQFPRLKVQTDQQFQDDQAKQVNQFLGIIFALLALSIIVAIFGIINTLVLAISERTRELGLLRAVGMSKRQVRTMIRYESVITALIGTILGTIVGILFAFFVSRPVPDLTFSLPVVDLIIVIVLGAIVGIFAAVWPARRASKLDVLESLSYE